MNSKGKWNELKSSLSDYVYENRTKIFDSAMREAKNIEREIFKDSVKPLIRKGVIRLMTVTILGDSALICDSDKVGAPTTGTEMEKTKFEQVSKKLRTFEDDDGFCDEVL
ncbi:13098_t:CDS:1, partial [Acaulospora colombiana]